MEVKKYNLSPEVKKEKIQAYVAKIVGKQIQHRNKEEKKQHYPHMFEEQKENTPTTECFTKRTASILFS